LKLSTLFTTQIILANDYIPTLNINSGDIFLVRNFGGEDVNTSPGYYNHVAIFGPLNWVIEAQQTPDAIIAVPIWYFLNRYPEILVLRNVNSSIANRTAHVATQFVGRRYAKAMSMRPLFLWKTSDNCVSFIKRIYNQVIGTQPPWIIPDHLLKTTWLKQVALKKDYENYVSPTNHQLGMQKIWLNKPAEEFYY